MHWTEVSVAASPGSSTRVDDAREEGWHLRDPASGRIGDLGQGIASVMRISR